MYRILFIILSTNFCIVLNEIKDSYKNNCVDDECTLCRAHYFVFELPQDNDILGLKSGQKICVECPFQQFMEDLENLYCGDCLDNSQTWNIKRVCSYDYKTYSTYNSVYHKKDRLSKELFYVVEFYQANKPEKIQYTTINCKGCDHFCKEKSQDCFLVPQEFQYDTNNMYFSCKEGYSYNQQRQMCEPCPQNCYSCYLNTCLICNNGFSKIITRESLSSLKTSTSCIPCFEKCTNCYFGKNGINLNVLPWDQYNNIDGLYTKDLQENQGPFFDLLFNKYGIAQRCEQCESTSQLTYIPSLNRRSCVQCGTKCRRCEYYSFWLNQRPSRNPLWIVEPQNKLETQELLESQFVLRCRECSNYLQIFNAIGTKCTDCSIIHCVLCHKTEIQKQSKIPFSTLSVDFEPQQLEDGFMEKCVLCEDGYYLTENGLCLIFDNQNKPKEGCLSFERSFDTQNCRKCQQDYILYQNQTNQVWVCKKGCGEILQDPNCESCIQQKDYYRCQICKVGYYVDSVTKKCKSCSADDYCLKCYTLTLNVVHHPEYYDSYYDEDSKDNIIYGPFCYQCIPEDKVENKDENIENSNNYKIGPFLNEDLRKCEKGGKKCKDFLAKGNKGFCDQCIKDKIRSSSEDGNDCIDCPDATIGCRVRNQNEINQLNRFYNPSFENQIYSTLAFKCDGDDQLHLITEFGRCIKSDITKERKYIIDVIADCSINQQEDKLLWKINNLYQNQKNDNLSIDKSLSKNATIILETKSYKNDDSKQDILNVTKLYQELNFNISNKIIINLNFKSDFKSCYFQKDTYFTTDIKKQVLSAQSIELNIQVENNERINWYVQSNIYFEYFSKITITGINIQPAVDCDLFPQIKKLFQPFSLQFILNDGLIINLQNITIYNYAASKFYSDKNLYTTPYSQMSILKKKFTPFYFIFTNTYDLFFNNVVIQSLNYLILQDTNIKQRLFEFLYDQNMTFPYFNFNINNVRFFDLGFEEQAIFDLKQCNVIKKAQINIKINIQSVSFNDVYFVNGAGFLSTTVKNSLNGFIQIKNLIVNNTRFNHSIGIVNFNNMEKITVFQFNILNSFVNHTNLFHITNIEIANSSVKNTQFSSKGRMIQTQHELQSNPLIGPNQLSLKLQIESIKFEQVICSTPQCLISITKIKNVYDIPINITIKNIEIFQINTQGFDVKIMNATTSAAIKIEKSYSVFVQDFLSVENSNLSILYVDQVWKSKFQNIHCHQVKNVFIKNNYCLFIDNPYKSVRLFNVKLQNLNAQDNSFIGISSWNNLIYNTTTKDYEELIKLEQILVQYCTVTTTQPGIPSSAIIIQSTQSQILQLSYMQFLSNKHFMKIPGSLSPSNPTFLLQSSLGKLELMNSKWLFNSVEGYAATLYLEAGIQNIRNVIMANNNDQLSQLNSDKDLNTEGGHLMILSYQAIVDNCTFQNSTAKQGGSIYIRALKEGQILIKNTSFKVSRTLLNSSFDSKGGCLYVDSRASQLNMTIIQSNFEDCVSRQEGGAIYILSLQSQQQLFIQDSSFSNCLSLSGTILKLTYDMNQNQTQQTKMVNINIEANQENYENFFSQLGEIQETEKYLFLTRTSAIEQDYGEIILVNVKSQGLIYQGFLSIKNPSLIKLSQIIIQNQILSFNPSIEIIEPIQNKVIIDTVKFANISSISLENIKCLPKTKELICLILQIRVDFSYIQIRPSLMMIDMITPQTFLTLKSILINKIFCTECIHGLVQIVRVSNIALQQSVLIDQCRCTDTLTSYYGCFTITTESYFKIQKTQDLLYNFTIKSNLTKEAIIKYTGILPSIELFQIYQQNQRILENQQNQRILENQENQQNQRILENQEEYFQYVVPNPSYLSHILIKQLFIQNNTCMHGCGLSIYELTTNLTNAYCTQNYASGRGGCIYFESQIQQRINMAQSNCFYNKASIGGCITLQGVYINNLTRAGNQITRNNATMFGNNINTSPQQMAILVDQIKQTIIQLENGIEFVASPIIMQSGYKLSTYKNQSIQIQYLDEEQLEMKYQYPATLTYFTDTFDNNTIQQQNCEIYPISNSSSIIKKYTTQFDNVIQGFQLSDISICFNPNLNKNINLTLLSSHIKQPVYVDEYPYSFKEYQKKQYFVIIKFQPLHCRLGEYYIELRQMCVVCPKNYYSLKQNTSCFRIDESKMKNTTGFHIYLYEGFWRPDPYNDQVESCIKKMDKCIGGFNVGNQLCTTGSIGALCENCDIHSIIWEDSYFLNWHSECQKCDTCTIYLVDPLVIITQIIIILILAYIALKSQEKNILYFLDKILKLRAKKSFIQRFPFVLMILINHLQFLSFLRFLNLEDKNFNTFIAFNSMAMPAFSLKIHLQCISEDNLYYVILYSLSIILGGSLCIFFIFKLRNKNIFSFFNFIILVFIYIQPGYLIELINLINYRKISGTKYNYSNISYQFDDNYNWRYNLILLILIGVVLAPIIFCVYIYFKFVPTKYKNLKVLNRIGIIYSNYSKKAFIIQFIFRQIKLLTFILLSMNETLFFLIPIFCLSLIMFSQQSLFGSNKQYPYKWQLINKLDEISNNLIILSYVISALFNQKDIGFTNLPKIIILFVFNLFFFIYFFIQLYRQKVSLFLEENYVKEKLKKKHNLRKKFKSIYENWKILQQPIRYDVYLNNILYENQKIALQNEQAEIQNKQAVIQNKQAEVKNKQADIQNKQAVIQNKQAVIQNKQAEIQNKQAVIQNQQAVIQNQQAIIENQQAVIQNKQAVIQNQQAVIQNQQAIIENQQARIENQQAVIQNQQAIIENQQARIENQQAVIQNQQAIIENQQAAIQNQQAIIENEQAIIQNQQAIIENQQAIIENQQAVIQNKQTIIENEQAIIQNQQAIIENEQAIIENKQAIIENQKRIQL
ncbi:unnamed protein product [Paramecium sonneborni]|uniref:Transmembrane protein n=1 Tax=Paramecium sonneborni TaxID=65129 RepID=A0A8S1PT10_9CILI|nr:unnamed protein product [Paramecium sonneborni]